MARVGRSRVELRGTKVGVTRVRTAKGGRGTGTVTVIALAGGERRAPDGDVARCRASSTTRTSSPRVWRQGRTRSAARGRPARARRERRVEARICARPLLQPSCQIPASKAFTRTGPSTRSRFQRFPLRHALPRDLHLLVRHDVVRARGIAQPPVRRTRSWSRRSARRRLATECHQPAERVVPEGEGEDLAACGASPGRRRRPARRGSRGRSSRAAAVARRRARGRCRATCCSRSPRRSGSSRR